MGWAGVLPSPTISLAAVADVGPMTLAQPSLLLSLLLSQKTENRIGRKQNEALHQHLRFPSAVPPTTLPRTGHAGMLKKIPVKSLVPGMFVDLSDLAWLDHPFLKRQFLIDTRASIDKLSEAGLSTVFIDTNRGADLEQAAAVAALPTSTPQPLAAVTAVDPLTATTYTEELTTARGIHNRASEVIKEFMADARIGKFGDLQEIGALAGEMVQSITRNHSALVSLTSLKRQDEYTFMHCVSVGIFMISLGRQLGLGVAQLRLLGAGGLMHDVGKAQIPLVILNKPGSLDDDESRLMRSHPQSGYDALLATGFAESAVLDVVLHHHEKPDGSGYPDAISGDALTLFARIAAVADVYDAITSNRVYHSAMQPTAALRLIRKRAGYDFDSTVAQALIKIVGIYPIGSLVRLSSRRLAIVTEQNAMNSTKPRVLAFFSTSNKSYIEPEPIDLAVSDDAIESDEDPAAWDVDLRRFWHL